MTAQLLNARNGLSVGVGPIPAIDALNNHTVSNLTVSGAAVIASPSDYNHAAQINNVIGRNVIVNGDMSVAQVNGTTLTTPVSSGYPIDNVSFYQSVAGTLQTQQVSTALNSLGATTALTTTVFATRGAPAISDLFCMLIPIEGYNFARFQYGTANAKAGSLQFKARASVAGTYSGAIRNYGSTRSYVFTYNLTANTDILVTIPNIPGDTGGTWVGATNAGAVSIIFDAGTGSTCTSATVGAWQAGNYVGATSAIKLCTQPNGSTLTITDVQFEVGSVCTTYERKLYDQVLRECQRYARPLLATRMGYVNGANELRFTTSSQLIGMRAFIPGGTTIISIEGTAGVDFDVFSITNGAVQSFTSAGVDTGGSLAVRKTAHGLTDAWVDRITSLAMFASRI